MTELTFVGVGGDLFILTLAWNRIIKVSKMVNGIPTSTPLEGLQFNMAGIVKEHPDLEGKPFGEMRKIAVERFRTHLKSFVTEKAAIDYLREDLGKHGNKLIMITRPGFRPQRVK